MGSKTVARESILEAAIRCLCRVPAGSLTVDAIAREAGCAKGLVHYHFKTKSALFAAAAERLWANRTERWTEALSHGDPKEAIDRSWTLLTEEAEQGITKACASLSVMPDDMTGQAVNRGSMRFGSKLASSIEGLFGQVGLAASVPIEEIGSLAAAVVMGMGMQLDSAADGVAGEGAYAAFWAGLLSLTHPGD